MDRHEKLEAEAKKLNDEADFLVGLAARVKPGHRRQKYLDWALKKKEKSLALLRLVNAEKASETLNMERGLALVERREAIRAIIRSRQNWNGYGPGE